MERAVGQPGFTWKELYDNLDLHGKSCRTTWIDMESAVGQPGLTWKEL